MAERQIVVLIVAGSSPVPHPCLAFVAQLDRAPDFESVGRRFEPCQAQSAMQATGSQRPFLLFLSCIQMDFSLSFFLPLTFSRIYRQGLFL